MGVMKRLSVEKVMGFHPNRKFVDFTIHAFFDRDIVLNEMDKVTRRALQMAAADVRREARRSMKAGPLGTKARPGQAPLKHKHSSRGKKSSRDYGLERSIMYAYDSMSQSAVVGPSSVRGAGVHPIAERHEFGGTITIRNKRRRLRRLGGSGEIRVESKSVKLGREPKDRKLRMATKDVENSRLGPAEVTYGRLFTAEQVRRANRINAMLYGPAIIHGRYPEREFMQPSLQKIAPQLPEYFVKAVK